MSDKGKSSKYIFRVLLVQSGVLLLLVGLIFVVKSVSKSDYNALVDSYTTDSLGIESKATHAWDSLKAVVVKEGSASGTGGVDEKVSGNHVPDNCSESQYVVSRAIVKPVSGSISCKYGKRVHPITKEVSFHTGLDIAADAKKPIYSAFAGKVVEVGKGIAYGNYLYIEHGDGVRTFYAHCSKVLVKEGDIVDAGQKVALVGSTGWSTGPHLHFGVKIGDTWFNPSFALDGVYA